MINSRINKELLIICRYEIADEKFNDFLEILHKSISHDKRKKGVFTKDRYLDMYIVLENLF